MHYLLLLDNYDSFTYNLYHLLQKNFNGEVIVKRDYQINIEDLHLYKGIVISPGPGSPETTPKAMEILSKLYKTVPILGICLGMQCINNFFGGKTVRSNYPVHGKTSIFYKKINSKLFLDIPKRFKVARYHSLKIEPSKEILITGTTENDLIMSIEHKTLPIYGLQFHPESFLSEYGNKFIQNFIEITGLNE